MPLCPLFNAFLSLLVLQNQSRYRLIQLFLLTYLELDVLLISTRSLGKMEEVGCSFPKAKVVIRAPPIVSGYAENGVEKVLSTGEHVHVHLFLSLFASFFLSCFLACFLYCFLAFFFLCLLFFLIGFEIISFA